MLLAAAQQGPQTHLVGFTPSDKKIYAFSYFSSLLAPTECYGENSICWRITYLAFQNWFRFLFGNYFSLLVFRNLACSFICLLLSDLTLLGLVVTLFGTFRHQLKAINEKLQLFKSD